MDGRQGRWWAEFIILIVDVTIYIIYTPSMWLLHKEDEKTAFVPPSQASFIVVCAFGGRILK